METEALEISTIYGVEGIVHRFEEEEEKGIAKIQRFEISDKEATSYNVMNRSGGMFLVRKGTYCKLFIHGELMMSDTPMERYTNFEFINSSNGRVLIAGLGVGMTLQNILEKPEITEVVVIEKHQDVIDLVEPKFKHPKLKVIRADIFDWKAEKGEKFDTIYFDIWADISGDNLDEMSILHKKFRKHLNKENPKKFMDSWLRGYIKTQVRIGRL